MEKGSAMRRADHAVDAIFLDRWSPRAMSGEEIPAQDLMTLFEAARWAPSAFNNQPWRILYARRDSEHWPLFLSLLVSSNQIWADKAAALLVFVSKTTFDHNGKPARTHAYDTGAAWENLALQATARGYVAHGMQGFDYERAKAELRVPEGYQVEAMAAVGKPGAKDSLPDVLQAKESPNDRRPVSQTACEGPFCF